ncbi:MAG TPA: hypothetical protein VIL20_17360, partial [Sandaracinaceae bacterium]
MSHCERCGREAPTADLSFHQIVGLGLLAHHRKDAGRLCRICAGEVFRRATLVTALFGWLGLLAAPAALVVLPLNAARYRRARRLPPPPPESKPDAGARARWARPLRFGTDPLMLGIVANFGDALTVAATVFAVGLVSLERIAAMDAYWTLPVAAFGVTPLLVLAHAVLTLRAATRVPSGTRGRARILVMAWSAIARVVGAAALTVVLALVSTDPTVITFGIGASEVMPLGWRGALETVQSVALAQGTLPVLVVALVLQSAAGAVLLVSSLSAWFLIPPRARRVFWGIVDATLLLAFVAVTLLLPIRPPADQPDAWQLPALRLGVTALFAVRVLFHVIPLVLDVLEGRLPPFGLPVRRFLGGFRLRVASRMLRARKSGFLTAAGALSIFAVAVSSCALTTVLSVMGGFRNDLKRKILGNNAHVVIDREHGSFEGWARTLETVRAQPHVVGATPYVQGEVMITSATNLSGAILRGIDPTTIGDVTELPRNMRHGRLEYLSHPERLLSLRAEEMSRSLL